MGREFRVACPNHEVDSLRESINNLQQRVTTMQNTGKVFGADRIAIITALNITHEFAMYKADAERRLASTGYDYIDISAKEIEYKQRIQALEETLNECINLLQNTQTQGDDDYMPEIEQNNY